MVKKFKFLLDPLFCFSLSLYIINKAILLNYKFIESKFIEFYLNDILLIPILVPILLYFSYVFRFRRHASPPDLWEITVPFVIWAIAFEIIGPFCFGKGTADIFDVMAYFSGGIISWTVWNCVIITVRND